MTAKEQILHSLHEQREILNRRYPIRRLALFGSWARGDAREDSDVDVLVDVDPSIGMGFIELAEELERALGRHVDLVSRLGVDIDLPLPDRTIGNEDQEKCEITRALASESRAVGTAVRPGCSSICEVSPHRGTMFCPLSRSHWSPDPRASLETNAAVIAFARAFVPEAAGAGIRVYESAGFNVSAARGEGR